MKSPDAGTPVASVAPPSFNSTQPMSDDRRNMFGRAKQSVAPTPDPTPVVQQPVVELTEPESNPVRPPTTEAVPPVGETAAPESPAEQAPAAEEIPLTVSPPEPKLALVPEPDSAVETVDQESAADREPDVPEGLEGIRTPRQILQQMARGQAAADAVAAQLAAQGLSDAA